MKRIFVALLMLLLISPISCKKDSDISDPSSKTINSVEIQVTLPTGTTWKVEDLKITSSTSQQQLSLSKFDLTRADINSPEVIYASSYDGRILLSSYLLAGQKQTDLNATSTALALLMVNPVTASLNEIEKSKVIANFLTNSRFPDLVKQVENSIINRLDIFDKSNVQLISLVLNIWQKVETTGLLNFRSFKAIVPDLQDPNNLKIINRGSSLVYYANIYKNGVLVRESPIRIPNITLNTSVVSTADYFIKNPDKFETCFNDIIGLRNVDKPVALCPDGPGNLLTVTLADPVKFSYPEAAKYTIYVTNGLFTNQTNQNLSGTKDADNMAITENAYTLFFALFDTINPAYGKQAKSKAECINKIGTALSKRLLETIDLYATKRIKAGQLLFSLVQNAADVFTATSCIYNLDTKNPSNDYGTNAIKHINFILSAIQQVDRFGSAFNLGFLMRSIIIDEPSYEYCVEVTATKSSLCEEKIPSGSMIVGLSCFTNYQEIGYISNFATGHSYDFNVSFKEKFSGYPYRYLYLITPDDKSFIRLELDSNDEVIYKAFFAQGSSGYNIYYGDGNPSTFDVLNMYNFIDKLTPTGKLSDYPGIYKFMVVLFEKDPYYYLFDPRSKDLGKYIKSKIVTLKQPLVYIDFYDPWPCTPEPYISGQGYNSKYTPKTPNYVIEF